MGDWAPLQHVVGTIIGAVIGNLAMLPLVKRHLLNLHKRVGVLENQLGVEPTTPAPGFELSLKEITNPRGKGL